MNAMREIRKNVFKLTQKQFADLAGVPQSRVSRWETGESAPTLDELQVIRAAAKDRKIRLSDKVFFGEAA